MGRWKKGDPIPKVVNQSVLIRVLEAFGWTNEVGGKHVVKMTKPGRRPITLPMHQGKDYGPKLRSAILGQAELDSECDTEDRRGE